jgi:hypothetical protein
VCLRLKRVVFVSFCVVVLCLIGLAGTVDAYKEGYTHVSYELKNAVTLDGKWTNATEWWDALPTSFGTNASFRNKMELISVEPTDVWEYVMVESLDNTDDAGDYWQICFDCEPEFPYNISIPGSPTPQPDDLLLNITGHANAAWFVGNGTGWVPTSTPNNVTWCNAKDTSPTISVQHWILELRFERLTFGIGGWFVMRVAVYDAHDDGFGLQAWPPTSADIPNDWGFIDPETIWIPEGLSFATVAALTSVTVVAGSIYLKKRQKSPFRR